MSGLADLCGSFEQLESRRLLDATLVNGVITVTTQPGVADIIVVANDANQTGNIIVAVNDASPVSFAVADATGISIDTGDGDDRISFDQSLGPISLPTTINAGDGNDSINGSAGADRIYCGSG